MHENFFSTIFFFTISILMDFRYFVTLRFYGDIFESSGGSRCMSQLKPLYNVHVEVFVASHFIFLVSSFLLDFTLLCA